MLTTTNHPYHHAHNNKSSISSCSQQQIIHNAFDQISFTMFFMLSSFRLMYAVFRQVSSTMSFVKSFPYCSSWLIHTALHKLLTTYLCSYCPHISAALIPISLYIIHIYLQVFFIYLCTFVSHLLMADQQISANLIYRKVISLCLVDVTVHL
ncbi:hypothetical protein EGW08_016169 [Elysia chlorotica]|uniref:Uncharacterized protein n=1 Tax=Elysia chlorotica TaxID=188477 RepID=A0A3S1BVS2_ELYCH|nr:hypothetical protein EGW08_016169 [Elysia chlorotica]